MHILSALGNANLQKLWIDLLRQKLDFREPIGWELPQAQDIGHKMVDDGHNPRSETSIWYTFPLLHFYSTNNLIQ